MTGMAAKPAVVGGGGGGVKPTETKIHWSRCLLRIPASLVSSWIADMSCPLLTNITQLSHLSGVSRLKASLCSLVGQYINSAELA
jgi:hypothetical protein